MCSKTETMKSTIACWNNIVRLKRELDTVDVVVIGAGAGLSTSAGFTCGTPMSMNLMADDTIVEDAGGTPPPGVMRTSFAAMRDNTFSFGNWASAAIHRSSSNIHFGG